MKRIQYIHQFLRIAIIILFSVVSHNISSAAPVGTIRDSFDIFSSLVDMIISPNNDIYILDHKDGVFKVDLESNKVRSLLNEENGNYKNILSSGENDLFVSSWNYPYNIIWHSNDKGTTWEKISLSSYEISKMCSDGEKRLWFTDSKANIYFSENNGKSWTTITYFCQKNNYINDIKYDKNDKSLLIVLSKSFEKYELYKSVDNGVSFTTIPTPADQIENYDGHAQTRPIKISFDEEYYHVQQDTFFAKTSKTQIEWKVTSKQKTDKVQNSYSSYGFKIGECTDGSNTWVLTNKGFLCKISDENITADKIQSEKPIHIYNQEKDTTHENMTIYNGIYYLANYKAIYCKDGDSKTWYRYLDTDNYPEYVWKDCNGVYMCDNEFNKFQINQEIDSIKPCIINFADLKEKQIKNIRLSKGIFGCYNGYSSQKSYRLKNNHFVVDELKNSGKKKFLKNTPRKISKSSAYKLLQSAYMAMCGNIDTIPFEITEKELQVYKKEIEDNIEIANWLNLNDDSYFHWGNLSFINEDYDKNYIKVKDLRRLSTYLDTFKITQDTLHSVLTESYSGWCTAGRYCIVELIMNDGSCLKLENSDWNPNYLCCPWTTLYNGNPFLLKSLAVGKSIDDMTKGTFLNVYNKKEYAIEKIILHLLKNWQKDEK